MKKSEKNENLNKFLKAIVVVLEEYLQMNNK